MPFLVVEFFPLRATSEFSTQEQVIDTGVLQCNANRLLVEVRNVTGVRMGPYVRQNLNSVSLE